MNSIHLRATAGFAVAALVFTTISVPEADAQTRYSSYSQWRSAYQRSSEGEQDSETIERATSRDRYSSATRRAIEKLDDDPVDDMPVPILFGIAPSQLSRNFGDARDGGARTHEGLDIMAPRGAYIVSPTDAVVTRVGEGSSAGKYVYTANPGEETFAYMHLDEIADGLKAGTVLKKGDLIGYVGNTGNAIGGATHLHFEIREGRKATDPFPRLTKDWTLKERVAAAEEILNDADDEEEEVDTLIAAGRGVFIAAKTQGIELPDDIDSELGSVASMPAGSSSFARDLTLGSSGADVTALQAILIAEAKGPKATALASAGATGYFGAMTQAALAEYQASIGINPSSGYFGPLTRARILAAS